MNLHDLRKLADEVEEMYKYLMVKAIDDYCSYVELVNDDWIKAKHISYICRAVQDFLEDGFQTETGPARLLIISMPPQHGKTMSITETLPSWYLGKNPSANIIMVSYGEQLAERFGRRNKEKLEVWGEPLFGVKLSKHKKSDSVFELENHSGTVISRGNMGGITGNRADLVVIDDPVKNREQADSETQREKLWNEFNDSIYSRLSAFGKIIIIATRWHEDDLPGRLIRLQKMPMKVINIPCEAEEDDVLGREVGEPLFPEIGKGKKWLEETKRMYLSGTNMNVSEAGSGIRAWNALYQGRPVALEGNMIKKDWWKYYEKLPNQFDDEVISIDCAFKGTDTSDFVVLLYGGKFMNDFYFIDAIHQRLDFPDTIKAIRAFALKHPTCKTIMIEDKANGPAVIDTLKSEIIGIVPFTPQGSKESRVSAVTPAIESGHCYLPKFSAWTSEFIAECSAFPNGKNDDYVDACSQLLSRLYLSPGRYRSIKPVGFYTPKEREAFEEKYNKHSSGIRRPGRIKEKSNAGKFNLPL